MKPYTIHNGLDLRTLDGVKVFRIVWIKQPMHALCQAEHVTIHIKDKNNITLTIDEKDDFTNSFYSWFEKCHDNKILNEEIQWIETYDETL